MNQIHLNTLHTDNSNDEANELSCPRCHNDETLGFASDGDRFCCKRCLKFFQTRNGDLAGTGLNRGSDPAISERLTSELPWSNTHHFLKGYDMKFPKLCSNVSAIQDGLKLTRDEAFSRLAMAVADDADLDPSSVASELDDIGRSAEELSSAADLILRRRHWVAQLQQETALLQEHNKLAEKDRLASLKHSNDLLLLRAARESEVREISQALQRIDAQRGDAQTARNKLIETSPDYQRLRKLWEAHGQLVIALQNDLPRELRRDSPANQAGTQLRINAATIERDRLAAEITRIEREALQ